jgi:uncharacterized protein (UPF0254 family)
MIDQECRPCCEFAVLRLLKDDVDEPMNNAQSFGSEYEEEKDLSISIMMKQLRRDNRIKESQGNITTQ